jgi:outer membrane lipoprotein-sorting protein
VKKALFAFVCLSLFVLGCKQEEAAAPVTTEEVAVAETAATTPEVATSTETVVAPEAAAVAGN